VSKKRTPRKPGTHVKKREAMNSGLKKRKQGTVSKNKITMYTKNCLFSEKIRYHESNPTFEDLVSHKSKIFFKDVSISTLNTCRMT
jgi:hypothetical protein